MLTRLALRLAPALAALALLLSLPAAPARAADTAKALEAAPADAHIVFVVPSLSAASDKVGALNKALGLNVAEMDNFLGKLKSEAGAINGVDDEGAMLIVLPNIGAAMMGQGDNPPMVMLVPVTDYDAFIGNYNPVTEDGSKIASLTMPEGQPGYAKQVGTFAAMGPLRAAVEGYEPGGADAAQGIMAKLGTLGGRAAAGADALAYFDLEAMAPVLTPLVDLGLAQFNQQMDQMAQFGMDAQQVKMQKDMMAMYAAVGKLILRDASAAAIGATMADKGNGVAMTVQFKPDTQLAQMFPGGGQGPTRLLTDLPDRPYIVAAAMDTRAMDMGAIADQVLQRIPDGEANPMMAMYKDSLPMAKQIDGMAVAFYAPQPGGAMGILNILQIAYAKDADKLKDLNKKYIESMNNLAVPAGPDGQMKFTTTYNTDAMKIEGVDVDQYQVTMNFPPQMAQQMGMMTMILGGSGYGGYIATKDNAMVSTMVTDPNLITAGLKAVGGGAGIGADTRLAELRKEALPEKLAAEGYLSFTGIGQLANQFLPMFGMPPINVPAEIQPIAFGMGVEDAGVSVHYYVPNATVKFLIDEGKKFAPMGGPGGGPPPF